METTTIPSAREILRGLPSISAPAWPLDIDATVETPQEQFWDWLGFAIEAGVSEPHAMTLSTVDADGRPDARVLILKDLDARGWHFASDAASPKGRQLAANPHAALTFYWPKLGRQVRLRGRVTALDHCASDADFLGRSPSARAMALLGRQSRPLSTPSEIDALLGATTATITAAPQTLLPSWTVYVLAPEAVEFWQGDRNRRHKRLRYSRDGAGWSRQMLWP